MTQWDKVELLRLLKTQVDDAIKTDFLKPSDAMKLLADYERLLQEYTYLSLNGTKLVPQPGNWLPLSRLRRDKITDRFGDSLIDIVLRLVRQILFADD